MTLKAQFNPYYTQGQTVTAAAVAANVAINPTAKQVCVTNIGANTAYVRIGSSKDTFAASTKDMPIPSAGSFQSQRVLTKGDGADTLSYISAAGTTLHIIPGEGF